MSDVQESPVKEIELAEHELVRIVITQHKSGEITSSVKSANEIDVTRIIGLMEVVKADTLYQGNQDKEPEMVEITLNKMDFEADKTGFLKRQGLKVGDKTMIRKDFADLRKQHQAKK